MNVLSNEEIKAIRMSVDIVEVISRYVPLIQKGKNYFGVCPFHDDRHPSMSVSKEKQIYTCFSCGATGNVFQFIQDYEHITFPEALKMVGGMAGLAIDIGQPKKNYKPKNQELYDIYELSMKFYQNNINTELGKEAKAYLKSREIDDSIIKEFQIGLALKEKDTLVKILKNKQYKEEIMLRCGLIHKNDYGYLDSYYNRIMFPLWDISGKVVGFSGRIYHGEDASKYVNTRETEIFKKGELLYNYHRAKEECRKENSVIVMEGFMDVIRAYTVGVKHVIATMGTAVTKEQALLIKRLAKEVILCFDGDQAGAKATYSCANELMKQNIVPKVVRLEEGLDPDDYIKQYGKEKFLTKLRHPVNIMDFKISYLKEKRNLSDNEDMAEYVNDLLKELLKIDDDILIELTLKKMSEESNLDVVFLRDKLDSLRNQTEDKKKVIQPASFPVSKEKEIITNGKNRYQKAEQYLLYYMLRSEEVIELYQKKISYMPTEKYRLLAYDIHSYYKKNGSIDAADLITALQDNPVMIRTIGEIAQLNLKEVYKLEEIEDYIETIWKYNIKTEQKRLQEQLKKEIDEQTKANLLQQLLELKVRGEKNVE